MICAIIGGGCALIICSGGIMAIQALVIVG